MAKAPRRCHNRDRVPRSGFQSRVPDRSEHSIRRATGWNGRPPPKRASARTQGSGTWPWLSACLGEVSGTVGRTPSLPGNHHAHDSRLITRSTLCPPNESRSGYPVRGPQGAVGVGLRESARLSRCVRLVIGVESSISSGETKATGTDSSIGLHRSGPDPNRETDRGRRCHRYWLHDPVFGGHRRTHAGRRWPCSSPAHSHVVDLKVGSDGRSSPPSSPLGTALPEPRMSRSEGSTNGCPIGRQRGCVGTPIFYPHPSILASKGVSVAP